MGAQPTIEKAPGGLKEPWLGIWRYAVKDLKASGLWRPSLQPMLVEYVNALRLAREQRLLAESTVQVWRHKVDGEYIEVDLPPGVERNQESGLTHMHAGFASSLKYMAEARNLAEVLGLTAKAQKALTAVSKEPDAHPDDPFAGFANVSPIRRDSKSA